jgi:hypothetical protein
MKIILLIILIVINLISIAVFVKTLFNTEKECRDTSKPLVKFGVSCIFIGVALAVVLSH